jgi:hypothetical protein
MCRLDPPTVRPQRYHKCSNKREAAQVTAAWQELHLPAGWSEITLVAPKLLIAEFKRRSRAARKQLLRKTERRIQSASRSKPD